MSLAEELLADLEDEDDEQPEVEAEAAQEGGAEEPMEEDVQEDKADPSPMASSSSASLSLRDTAKLYESDQWNSVMGRIDAFSSGPARTDRPSGTVEADPEYMLIVEANNMAADIDEEISTVYKFAKEKYSVRFPELETLVVQPLDYLMTANELGNNVFKAKDNKVLEQFLTQATIMVVSVTASTTQGTDLSSEELRHITDACSMALNLSESKKRILSYVESRMTFIAPNLSAVVGASTAAKLMGAAGGLTPLSKMPSGYLGLLGQQKKSLSGGFVTQNNKTAMPHTGFVFHADVVQQVPADLRRKVSRVVINKCTLAARVDAAHESTDGAQGRAFLADIEKKIDKLQEPPPVKAVKALTAPIEAPKKKRGGRRVLKQKERYAVTELRKQANRMNFGELEEDHYQSDLGYTRGNIGKSGVGVGIRMAQIDERTKVRISQTLKKNLQKQQATWGGTTSIKKHISGTASSVAFTPLQGLEIVNPNAAETKGDESSAKYFSSSSSFMKVKTPAPK